MNFHMENLKRRMRYVVVFAMLAAAFAVITVININSGNVEISMPDIFRILWPLWGLKTVCALYTRNRKRQKL